MKKSYVIPAEALEKVTKIINRISRKAARYGCEFHVEYGTPYAAERSIKEKTEFHTIKTIDTELVEVVDVILDSDDIKAGEYTVLAKIEHGKDGNVVRTNGDEYDPLWGTMNPFCEHCHSNHNLLYTYIVKGSDGVHQVGRTCLKDYCGIDPHVTMAYNELQDILLGEEGYEYVRSFETPVYDMVHALAVATRIYRERGYIRSGDAGCNRFILDQSINEQVSDVETVAAQGMAEMILAHADDDNMFHNLAVMVRCGYVKSRDFGYVAYAPVAVERAAARYAKEMERQAKIDSERCSEYVGQVGDKISIDIRSMELVASWENDYGMTHLYKIIDHVGNVYIWYASRVQDRMDSCKATVKAHNDRDGIHQTIVTRCKAC